MELVSSHRCFGGEQRFLRLDSTETAGPMRCSVFLPPAALAPGAAPVPALVFLAGLTCTEETFMAKAGAQRAAAEAGIALVAPDTSPRDTGIAGATQEWDFGEGAGFYLDATQAPWSARFRMESWIVRELLPLLACELPVDGTRLGLAGHSMGGHGALTLALRHPGLFRTLSALAPICSPARCPWGEKAFARYLGDDRAAWAGHDASLLMATRQAAPYPGGILVDQGLADKFLAEQLRPELLEEACARVGQPLTLRRHVGYDHGYYFIQSFIADHVAWHAAGLQAPAG
jgi:S-formylglutathione hydrolase